MARTNPDSGVEPLPLRALPAAALRSVLREGYPAGQFRRDLMAGLVVGVVALPLSMALSIAVGLPPQYGLYTAIVAGFLSALLGGSRTSVVGPTAAFVVVLTPIVARFGYGGLLMAGLMAGVILVAMSLLRLGRLIQFIPFPVTMGFTAGIAIVIALLQLKDLTGIRLEQKPEHVFDMLAALWHARASWSPWEFGIGLLTLAILMLPRFSRRVFRLIPRPMRRIPAPLVALPVAAVTGWLLTRFGHPVATIATRFTAEVGGQVVHGIPRLPPLPLWPWGAAGAHGEPLGISLATLRMIAPSAFVIAMLGAIESLLAAVVADGMAGTRHDPDSELLALGVANVVTPFWGGIPATGALARTATSIRAGGRTPVASIVHSLTVLAAILALAPLIGSLPMAGLAALLLAVAWNMAEAKELAYMTRVAPRSDTVVLFTCLTLTVVFDMVVAVTAGTMLAGLLFIRRMSEMSGGHFVADEEHMAVHAARLPKGVLIYDVAGPLFFGAAQKAMAELRAAEDESRAIILDMEGVPAMDITGLVALEGVIDTLARDRRYLVLAALRPQPAELLDRAGIHPAPGRIAFCDDIPTAVEEVERYLSVNPDPHPRRRPHPETSK